MLFFNNKLNKRTKYFIDKSKNTNRNFTKPNKQPMTKQSLTQEELSQLQSLRTTQSQIISSLGETEYQISLLEEKKQLLKTQVLELEKNKLRK
jgi:hypothetical protein